MITCDNHITPELEKNGVSLMLLYVIAHDFIILELIL